MKAGEGVSLIKIQTEPLNTKLPPRMACDLLSDGLNETFHLLS
jgi:hypothetical protein